MLTKLVTLLFIIAGLIHLLPSAGFFGGDSFHGLYGLNVVDVNLDIILRHRAVLFFLLGMFLVVAGFVTKIQWPVGIAGMVSALSFIVLAYWLGDYNVQLARVVAFDWLAVGSLSIALMIRLMK